MFSSQGISPGQNKVAVLHAAGPATSEAEEQSFLFFAGFAQATKKSDERGGTVSVDSKVPESI